MNQLVQPIFMDFEASSLRSESYPIEVAWSNSDGSIECYLIRPEATWIDWDDFAESNIHGISRDQLQNQGYSVEWIVARMSEQLKDQVIYVDGGDFDVYWCERLFDYKGYAGELPFQICHFNELLPKLDIASEADQFRMESIIRNARENAGGQHRADFDVKFLQSFYEQVTALVSSDEKHYFSLL